MKQSTYRILANGQTVSNNTWDTGLNNNDLIIGPTGSGKTRGYVKPNILQCNESLIITDTNRYPTSTLPGFLPSMTRNRPGWKRP